MNTPPIFIAGAVVRGSFHQRLRSVLQLAGGEVSLFEWATREEAPSPEGLQALSRCPITLFTVAPPDVAQGTIPRTIRAGVSLKIYNPARLVLGVPADPTTDASWEDDNFGFLAPWRTWWPGSSQEVIERVVALTALRPHDFRAPVAPALRLCLGQALLSQQRFEEAVAWLHPLLQESSPPRGARAALAYGYAHLERWSECVELCRAALDQADGLTASFYGLGLGLNGLGHYEAALGPFGRTLSTHPKLAGAWVGRGKALLHLGRPKEAVQALEQGLAAIADPARNAWAYEDAWVSAEAKHLLDQAQHDCGLQGPNRGK